MGLIYLETCNKCGHVGSPEYHGDSIANIKFRCRKCKSSDFAVRHTLELPKQKCATCGYEHTFNDVGCPKCVSVSLTNNTILRELD